MTLRSLFAFALITAVLAPLLAGPAAAQVAPPGVQATTGPGDLGPFDQAPAPYTIRSITVEGTEAEGTEAFVRRTSGLEEGQEVTLPGGDALAEAIRAIYRSSLFSDIKILKEETGDGGVNLTIRVEPVPRLASYTFRGVEKDQRKDLKEKAALLANRPMRPSDIQRTKQIIKDYFAEKGYLSTEVQSQQRTTEDGRIDLTFYVDRGQRAEVEDITFIGNEAFDDGDLRGQMDEIKENRWWRFWKGENFKPQGYQEDLDRIIAYYNEEGYYDAQIVSDSVYLASDDELNIDVRVQEGAKYHISDIEWEGNTLYPDAVLTNALGFDEGDTYNKTQLEENLYGNRSSSDVFSLYLNRGYLRFNAEPNVRVVGQDSLALVFDVFEGEVYEVGEVDIAGNTKTKEHVIRRELYTVPGQTFSRDAIQESIRRLAQLNYFSQESISGGPNVSVDDQDQEVNLKYTVEEVGSDQLELSGTYSGSIGVILQLGLTFNNFSAQGLFDPSAWKPLPAGDGQQLSLNVRTSGTVYQSYSVSFTEPWFRGRPTPIGGSVSYSRLNGNLRSSFNQTNSDGRFQQFSSSFFYRQRLDWPDDKFQTSSSVSYQMFDNDSLYTSLPQGFSQQVSFEQGISRNSLNNPIFPTSGSKISLSLEVAPPIGELIQFYKPRFKTNWNVPLREKVSINFSTDYGYVGSLTGDEVEFQKFDVGGSPLDAQGFSRTFGSDIIFMRGYPSSALNPRVGTIENPREVSGSILNKYTSELRWVAVQSPQLQAAPYLFADAANTWRGFDTYDPTELYRSVGLGARLSLPIVGLIDINYGYSLDEWLPVAGSGEDGQRGWRFQISLGQGFGQ